jgi:hypothetical protein
VTADARLRAATDAVFSFDLDFAGCEEDIARAVLAKLDHTEPPVPDVREQVVREVVGALRKADSALSDARDGLDLGLGCARDVEGDLSPVPVAPRSKRQDEYLKRARAAHREVRAALSRFSTPATEGREDWRCECGDLNRWHEVFCYRCGAGSPDDADCQPSPDPEGGSRG